VTKTLGGGVRFGYPLSEPKHQLRLGRRVGEAGDVYQQPAFVPGFVSLFGNQYSYGAGTVGLSSDTRDSAIQTTRGTVTRTTFEIAAGDLQYYKVNVFAQYFYPISRTLTLALLGDFGYANGFGDKEVPFFKNYYAGGTGSVRGFRPFSLGPQDSQGNVLGGTRKVVGSAEVQFPMPGAQQDKSLRLASFSTQGRSSAPSRSSRCRSCASPPVSRLSWISPFGPLKLSIAQPLNDKSGFDRVQRVQFQFGNTF
jgi:outer membrane protein insertion porin family